MVRLITTGPFLAETLPFISFFIIEALVVLFLITVDSCSKLADGVSVCKMRLFIILL